MTIDPLTPLVMNQLDRLITKAECDRVIKVEIPTDLMRALLSLARKHSHATAASFKAGEWLPTSGGAE